MSRSLVAAASAEAAEAGQQVADAGGSAVDVAIAAALVSMTTELGIVSPGGGAFLTIWSPDGDPVVIDGYAEMPGRGLPPDAVVDARTVAMGYGGGMETIVGWGSVATPGAFAGFKTAWDRFGRAPWHELLAPSVDLARHGFPVSAASGYYLQYAHDVVYGWDDETAPSYHRPNGTAVQHGDIVRNEALASTLEALGEEGADLLYQGDLGRALVDACAERGGRITAEDIRAYEAVVRDPLHTVLGGWRIATNAPPAIGGITVATLLTYLERLGLQGWSALDVAKIAAAQDAVFSFRRTDLDNDGDRLTAAEFALASADRADLAALHRSPSTIHVSAVDATGLACAITSSAGYGSGATIPGTGFGLNNSLGEIELMHATFDEQPPGTRLASNMAPTVARHPDGTTLAIGSPGADRITSAIGTVLYNGIICDMSIEEAVDAPRLHAEVFEGAPTLAVEPGVDTSLVDDLHVRELPPHSMYFGGVQIAMAHPNGELEGAADPRRSGAVRIGGGTALT